MAVTAKPNESEDLEGVPSSPDSGSLSSGAPLIDGVIKEKKTAPAAATVLSKREVQRKARGVLWFIVFFMLFVFTIIVSANLAKKLQSSLFRGCSSSHSRWHHKHPTLDLVSTDQEDSQLKSPTCIHRRVIWKDDIGCSEVIHDFGSKWSALVDHRSERCLLFDMHGSPVDDCPASYPWTMDRRIGAPICRGPAVDFAPVIRIMHHISCIHDKNISYTGDAIRSLCSNYRLFNVDRIIVQFFDKTLRRIARHSAHTFETTPDKDTAALPNAVATQTAKKPVKKSFSLINAVTAVKKILHLKSPNTEQMKKIGPLASGVGLLPQTPPKIKALLSKQNQEKNPHAVGEIRALQDSDIVPSIQEHFDEKVLLNVQNKGTAKIVEKKVITSKFPAKTSSPVAGEGSDEQQKVISDEDDGTSSWEVLYTSIDVRGNLFEGRTLADLSQRMKEGKVGLLDLREP